MPTSTLPKEQHATPLNNTVASLTSTVLVQDDQDNTSLTSNDSDKQWREQVYKAVDDTGSKYHSFYELLGSNSSSDSLNDASHAATPERFPLNVIETNPEGIKRAVAVKHRPLYKWMETKGAKGVVLKVLSNLQITGHWGLTIGSYTYDIFQNKYGEVIFHVGEWRLAQSGETSRVKVKDVGFTYMTDKEILATAKAIHERMRPDGYDERFNNCHRFVNELAERIVPRRELQNVALRLRLLYIWNSLPASYFFQAVEHSKQLVRVPKKVLLDTLIRDLRAYGYPNSDFWHEFKKHSVITSKVILFLLTVGAMTVFLQMARALTRWDPENPEHLAEYLTLFSYIPGVSEDLAKTYLSCAFQGPRALRSMVNRLIQESGKDPKGFLKKSFIQLKDTVS